MHLDKIAVKMSNVERLARNISDITRKHPWSAPLGVGALSAGAAAGGGYAVDPNLGAKELGFLGLQGAGTGLAAGILHKRNTDALANTRRRLRSIALKPGAEKHLKLLNDIYSGSIKKYLTRGVLGSTLPAILGSGVGGAIETKVLKERSRKDS